VSIRAALDATIPERAFQQSVIDLATWLGWRCYHTHDSRRSEPGFPDLVCARPPRLVVLELKIERGEPTVDQRWWLDAFAAATTLDTHLVRPSDWAMLEDVLR
jgi:hypothetical protein